MHHHDKPEGRSGERTTRRGLVVEGQKLKEKPNPYQRSNSNRNRLQAHQTSWLRYAREGIMGRRVQSLSPR